MMTSGREGPPVLYTPPRPLIWTFLLLVSIPAVRGTCGVANCQTCKANTYSYKCNTCVASSTYAYVAVASGVCQKCPSNCLVCQKREDCSLGDCYTCKDGYYKNGGMCQVCAGITGSCTSCSNANTCDTCATGYYKDSTNLCLACPGTVGSCVSCSSGTACDVCTVGYYKASTNLCLQCPGFPNCQTCSTSGSTKCDTCKTGYYGNLCAACPQGCDVCTIDPNIPVAGYLRCTTCTPPQVTQSEGTCKACPEAGCATCALGVCLTCISGYYKQGTQCLACSSNTVGCTTCDMGTGTCTACSNDRYLSGSNACTECSGVTTGCTMCNISVSTPTCTACDSSAAKFLNSGNTCTDCWRPTQAECNVCVRPTGSTAHMWTTTGSTNYCQLHPVVGCRTAVTSTPAQCEACSKGKRLASASSCVACTSASSLADCTACGLPFEPKCTRYDCTTALGTNCNNCADRVEISGTCQLCHLELTQAQCSSCGPRGTDFCKAVTCTGALTTREQCMSCVGRYYDGSICQVVACTDRTLLISSQMCGACPGVVWVGSTCTACSANCLKCSSATVCTTCMDGYAKTTSGSAVTCTTAVSCDDPMSITTPSLEKCSACPGWTWVTGWTTCIRVYDAEETCSTQTTRLECWPCRAFGYVFDHELTPKCQRTCPANCLVCTLNDCTKCRVGYAVSGTSPNSVCSPVDCSNLAASGTPTQAKCNACPGYYWASETSLCDVQDCNNLPSSGATQEICDACPGYTYNGPGAATCDVQCPIYCFFCLSTTTCDVCIDGYTWNSGATACEKVTVGACADPLTITSPTLAICAACAGWTYVSGSTCTRAVQEDTGCSSITTENKCWACRAYGYIYMSNTCAKHCTTDAVTTDAATHCEKCTYRAWNEATSKCVVKAPYEPYFAETAVSHICDGNLDTPEECVHCIHRVWDSNNVCQVVNCLTVTSDTPAADCNACPGYFHSSTCQACSANCQTCTSTSLCTRCKYGYQLSGSACANVKTDCGSGPADSCNSCEGWYDNSGTCAQVTATTCATPGTAAKCDACRMYGYGWSGTDCQLCSALPAEKQCTECKANIWNSYKSMCEAATLSTTANIKRTQNLIYTRGDLTDWYPTDVVCSGNLDTEPECTYCAGRYFDTTCKVVSCMDVTLLGVTAAECTSCPGAFHDGSSCTLCAANCLSCSSETACDICMDGYKVSGSGCVKIANCYAPSDEAECLGCPGWYFANRECQRVTNSDCAARNTAKTCWACRSLGYVLVGSTCTQVCTSSTVISTADTCKRLGCRNTVWNTANSGECRASGTTTMMNGGWGYPLTCSATTSFDTCHCMERAWVDVCTTVDCSRDVTLMTQTECDVCTGKNWVGESCTAITTCASTTDMAVCNKCEGYYWDTVWASCLAFTTGDVGTGTTAAEKCHGGFYDTSSRCPKCSKKKGDTTQAYKWIADSGTCFIYNHVSIPSTPTRRETCAAVPQWFSLNGENTACTTSGSCSSITDCLECTGSTCDVCVEGKHWVGGSCVVCGVRSMSECENCGLPATGGLTTPRGYWVSASNTATTTGLKCEVCPASPSTADDCFRCSSGTKYWTGSACTDCGTGCATCTTSGCTACSDAYYLSAASTCTACPVGNCKTCNNVNHASSARPCDVCADNFCYDRRTSTCVSFTTDVRTRDCYQDTSLANTWSVICKVQNYLTFCDASSCTQSFCTSCSGNTCTQCMDGYYENSGSCSQCLGGSACLNCTSATACHSCQTGYYQHASQGCRLCTSDIAQCTSCTAPTTGSTPTCNTCTNGYYVTTANQCDTCSTHLGSQCSSCTKMDVCETCGTDYELSPDSLTCIPKCHTCLGSELACASTSGITETCGTNEKCMATVLWVKGQVEYVMRGCQKHANLPSNGCDSLICQTIGSETSACVKCCSDGGCNNWPVSQLSIGHILQPSFLVYTCLVIGLSAILGNGI